jgi:hypothetical protein
MRAMLVGFGGLVAGAAALLACNAVLGIDKASVVGDAGAGGNDGGASAFVAKDDCMDYCADMALTCATTETQEYLDDDVCRQMCKFHTDHFDEQGLNAPVDVSPTSPIPTTDSLYCRVWHAHAAGDNPQHHCPHAGPIGANECGKDPCGEFCAYAMKFCGSMAYATNDDCLQACNADGGYPGFPYLIGDAGDLASSGNTLNCRIYHLENFIFTGDAVHCSHVAADGGGVCN